MAVTKKRPRFDYYTGDRNPSFTLTLNKSDGSGALDISSSSAVKVHLRLLGADDNKFTGAEENASLTTDGTDGKVTYQLPTGGFNAPGLYYGTIEIDWSGDVLQHSSEFQVAVDDVIH